MSDARTIPQKLNWMKSVGIVESWALESHGPRPAIRYVVQLAGPTAGDPLSMTVDYAGIWADGVLTGYGAAT